jgi:hypothetical protein
MADLMPITWEPRGEPVDYNNVDWKAIGTVLDADMNYRKQQAAAEERAVRLQGFREYEKLVAAGAKPEEALRRAAPKLYFNAPEHLAAALKSTAPPPPPPTMPESIRGVPVLADDGSRLGNAVLDPRRGGIHSFVRPPSRELSVEADQEIRDANAEAAAARRRIAELEKLAVTGSSKEKELAAELLPQVKQQLFRNVERRRGYYPNKPELPDELKTKKVAPEPAKAAEKTAKPANEIVRQTKDGRRAVFDADTKEFIRWAN